MSNRTSRSARRSNRKHRAGIQTHFRRLGSLIRRVNREANTIKLRIKTNDAVSLPLEFLRRLRKSSKQIYVIDHSSASTSNTNNLINATETQSDLSIVVINDDCNCSNSSSDIILHLNNYNNPQTQSIPPPRDLISLLKSQTPEDEFIINEYMNYLDSNN